MQGLQLVSVNERTIASGVLVKPRKILIVTFAFVDGLLLGAMIALRLSAFKNHLRRTRALEVGNAASRILPEDFTRKVNVLVPETQVRL